jgi:hypothetical protein
VCRRPVPIGCPVEALRAYLKNREVANLTCRTIE